jgi:hypothetical protein
LVIGQQGPGYGLVGTVNMPVQIRTSCGSPGCACHADPDKRHAFERLTTRSGRRRPAATYVQLSPVPGSMGHNQIAVA